MSANYGILFLTNTKDHISRLPNEYQVIIFSLATNYNSKELSNIALVCKNWSELQAVNSLWKCGLNRCIKIYKYEIDLSSVTNYKEQIKIFAKTRVNDFKEILNVCALKSKISKKQLQDASVTKVQCVLDKIDHTNLFKKMILNKELELIAKLILCKPKFNAHEIAKKIFFSKRSGSDTDFIFSMIVKLNYNISLFFNDLTELTSLSPGFISNFIVSAILVCQHSGLKITDLIASGCELKRVELENPKISMLREFIPFFDELYKKGRFQPTITNEPMPSFSDEKLTKFFRKAPFSEIELKDFILDLLTKADLNLDFPCSAQGTFRKGTVLSQWRQQADLLPKGNALAMALAEIRPN